MISNKNLKNLQRQKKYQKELVWKTKRRDRKIYAQKQKELMPEIEKQKEQWLIDYPTEYNVHCTYYLHSNEMLQHDPNLSRQCEFKHSNDIQSLDSTFICLDVDIHDYENNNFGCDGYIATMCENCYQIYRNYGTTDVSKSIVCLVNKERKFVMHI